MNKFKIYITGYTPKYKSILNRLNSDFNKSFNDQYSLEVVDILENAEQAIEDNILVTPTLIKVSPEPTKRIVGDLSDSARIMQNMGIAERN
jgi:circadian clock protein KaiB